MHCAQPHVLRRTCLGLFVALRATAHHLVHSPLLGYAGQEVNWRPAEADCTDVGLLHGKFAKNGTYDKGCACGGKRDWQRDGARERIPRVSRAVSGEADANAHRTPDCAQVSRYLRSMGEGIGRSGNRTSGWWNVRLLTGVSEARGARRVTEPFREGLGGARPVALDQGPDLYFRDLLLVLGELVDQCQDPLARFGAE